MKNLVYLVIVSIALCMFGLAIAADTDKALLRNSAAIWGNVVTTNTVSQYPPAELKIDSAAQVSRGMISPAESSSMCRRYIACDPYPGNEANDVMANTVLSWGYKNWQSPTPVNITFDEVPLNTKVNGMVIGHAGFSCGTRAVVTTVGPGITMFNSPPNIESTTSEVLTIDFATPVYGVAYGFVLGSGTSCVNATTITLFDNSGAAIVTQSANAEIRGFRFVEGRNVTNSSVPIKRAVIKFLNSRSMAFTIDNLTYSLNPATILTASGVSMAEELVQAQSSGDEEIIFDDDMENGQQGWQHYLISGTNIADTWTLSTSRSTSPTHSWYSGISAASSGSTALESPVIDLSERNTAILIFDHWYSFDDCSGKDNGTFQPDGGIVEIQVLPNSNWVQIFPTGGYPGHLTATCDNPLGSIDAYTRDSGGIFVPAEFDLTQFAGNEVKIRFRVGWDCGNCVAEEGWYIDNVTVLGNALADPSIVYDVYLGENNQPDELYAADLNEPQCFVGGLDCNTTYYWKVVTKNDCDAIEGPIWSFKTMKSTDMLQQVIKEKHSVIRKIDQLLESEAAANKEITARMLDRNVKVREKISLLRAKMRVHNAMQNEVQAKDFIGRSIKNLWDALRELGTKNQPKTP